MDIRKYNREAWNREVDGGKNEWTIPVTPEAVAAARRGEWQVVLTPTIPVPRDWFPDLRGADVLCLASGGGQQGPLLAAAGALVTVLDNSPRMLDMDRMVAERDGLQIRTVEGDMRDLSAFADASFDLIFHPVSNVFVPDVLPVWREAQRVLRPGGTLLAGLANPLIYIFDFWKMDQGVLEVRFPLPYSDVGSLPPDELQRYLQEGTPLEWSHSLDEQIGGQLAAGFALTGFYEDRSPDDVLSMYLPTYIATRAIRLPASL